jgi:hypothetical protein
MRKYLWIILKLIFSIVITWVIKNHKLGVVFKNFGSKLKLDKNISNFFQMIFKNFQNLWNINFENTKEILIKLEQINLKAFQAYLDSIDSKQKKISFIELFYEEEIDTVELEPEDIIIIEDKKQSIFKYEYTNKIGNLKTLNLIYKYNNDKEMIDYLLKKGFNSYLNIIKNINFIELNFKIENQETMYTESLKTICEFLSKIEENELKEFEKSLYDIFMNSQNQNETNFIIDIFIFLYKNLAKEYKMNFINNINYLMEIIFNNYYGFNEQKTFSEPQYLNLQKNKIENFKTLIEKICLFKETKVIEINNRRKY